MQAVRETRAKYLSPRMAGQYGVEVPPITGPPPAAPPVLGLTMVPVAAGTQAQAGTQGDGTR